MFIQDTATEKGCPSSIMQSSRGAWKVGRFSGVSGLDSSVGLCPMKSRLCPWGVLFYFFNSSYSTCGSLMPKGNHPLVVVTSLLGPTDQSLSHHSCLAWRS